MKKSLPLLTAALLMTATSSAFAASSTDLTVTGKITPTACTPTLDKGGIVDYGKKSAKDLNPTTHTWFDRETIQLAVDCTADAQFAIKAIDNRKGTGTFGFGLGFINGTQKLGSYELSLRNPVGNIPVTPLYSVNNGTTWAEHHDGDGITPDILISFGNRTSGTWTPDFLKTVTVDLDVRAAIAPANGLDLSDEVTLDGSATLQIEYI